MLRLEQDELLLRQDGLPYNEDNLPFLEDFDPKMPNLRLFYPIYGIFKQNRLTIRVIKSIPNTVAILTLIRRVLPIPLSIRY